VVFKEGRTWTASYLARLTGRQVMTTGVEITKSKLQVPNKHHITSSKAPNTSVRVRDFAFGACNLFGA
jgi:hypothetical protein